MCPVFKSCITSPAIAADEATIDAISIVASINVEVSRFSNPSPISNTSTTVNNSVAIVIPETGEFDEPTTPAIYPATAAKKKAVIAKNNPPANAKMNEPVLAQ